MIFYLKVLERYIAGQDIGRTDWGEIWGRVSGVTTAEWDELRTRLKATYGRLSEMLRGIENWERNDAIRDSMAIMVDMAYHLGAIQQALCMVKRSKKQRREIRSHFLVVDVL